MRKGSFTLISKEDMYLMSRIIEGNPPNLGMIIARKMVKVAVRSKKGDSIYALPYGQLVSKIIQLKCNVPSNEVIDNEPSLQLVDNVVIRRMNFVI